MVDTDRQNLFYVISKYGMDNQYLYSVEQCSFGKQFTWTRDIELALLFSLRSDADIFKSKNLPNVLSDIQTFIIMQFDYSEKI